MREAPREPRHRLGGPGRVGQGGLHPGLLVAVECGVGEQVVEAAAQPGQRARDGAVDPLGLRRPVGAEVDQPHALAVIGLGEGVGERGAGVADALGEPLAAVQVTEGDVVDPVEDAEGHRRDTADGDVALAVAARAAADERVGQDDGAGVRGPVGEIGPHPVHRRAEHVGVAGPGRPQLLPGQGRFEVGQPVERDVPVVVGEDDGGGAAGDIGAQVDACAAEQAGADAESARRVVVPRDHHRRRRRARRAGAGRCRTVPPRAAAARRGRRRRPRRGRRRRAACGPSRPGGR